MSDIKISNRDCERFYKAWQSPKCKDKWIVDSPVGKQVADWLMATSKKGLSNVKKNTQFVPFISPVDGTEISCKRGLREHERKHGIRQVGDDIKLKGEE